MYHVDVLTGVVCVCQFGDKCLIPIGDHGSDYMSLIGDYEARNNGSLYSHKFFKYGEDFQQCMELATSNGFTKAGSIESENAQVELLMYRESIESLIDFISLKKDGSNFKNKLIKATAWAINMHCNQWGVEVKKFFDLVVGDKLSSQDVNTLKMSLFFNEVEREDLLSISSTLWMFDYSPYRSFAKYLIFGGDYQVGGYIPTGDLKVTIYDNEKYLHEFAIDSSKLKDDVVAFDIETDTSNGLGLIPLKTQITEIVLSRSHQTIVVSGDEKLILNYVVKYFNELSSDVRLIGWNNECFDNIVLQTRAEFHDIEGWSGSLYAVENDTIFEASGPTSQACGFRWDSVDHTNLALDIFQIILRHNRISGVNTIPGLKNFVEDYGCKPLRVDRSNLHLLSDMERNLYSLSDGICTLYAHSLVLDIVGGSL